jgi:hypothetical protein
MTYFYSRRIKEPVYVADTKDIILPFEYTSTPDVVLNSNFDPVDTLRFETNFKPYLNIFNPSWRMILVPKEFNGKSHLCLEIYEGKTFIPLNDEMVNQIMPFVMKSINELPNYTLIISSKKSLTYFDTVIPAYWLKSILPFINSYYSYDYVVNQNGYYVNLRNIYTPGNSIRPIELAYQSLYTTIISKLRYLYQFGSIVLDHIKNKDIIGKWNLTLNPSLTSDNKNLGIYHTLWHNTLFAADKTAILHQIANDNVIITLQNQFNKNIEISLPTIYTDGRIHIKVNNYKEASDVYRKILTIMAS